MNRPIVLTVHGQPAPKGSLTPVGNGRMVEGRDTVQRAKISEWRRAVADQARAHIDVAPGSPLNEPLHITVEFRFPATKSDPYRHHHTTYPDLDKLQRLVGDALVDAGLLRDDGLITKWTASKRYAVDEPPGCTITIESLADSEARIREVRKTAAALARKRAKATA